MKKIPLVKPEFNVAKLSKALRDIARSGILTKGKYLAEFEQKLKDYLKVKYVFATSSCTTALHLGLLAMGVKDGDEVLVSDFSFPASGNVIAQIGAKPVFVDIDLDTLCINLDDLKSKITSKSKAAMIVHPFGYPANMTEIMKIAQKHKLKVLEDAACALGSKHHNEPCGAWGDVGCFSFHPRKNITTGEGGALVTNDPKIAEKIEILRNHGGQKTPRGWKFIEIGYNYRLSELSAALGVEQMAKLDKIDAERKKVARKYLQKLESLSDIKLPHEPKAGDFNFQSFIIILPEKVDRDDLVKYMLRKNIETVLGTYAMHSEPSYRQYGYKPGDCPNSFYAYKHTLTLPLFAKLSETQMNHIVKTLKTYLEQPK